MEAGERHELVLVAHRAQLALELGDRLGVEVARPVEGGRAVVGQHLARVAARGSPRRSAWPRRDRGGPSRTRAGRRRARRTARGRSPGRALRGDLEEAVGRPLAGQELLVAVIAVGGQETRRVGVGAGDEQGRDVEHVGRQPRRDQLVDRLLRRHEHLAAHVAALLRGRELVLEVHAGGAGLDHRLHQLEGVQTPPKPASASATIGANQSGRLAVLAGRAVDLIGAHERVVDPLRTSFGTLLAG